MPAPNGKERANFSGRLNICLFLSVTLTAKKPISAVVVIDIINNMLFILGLKEYESIPAVLFYDPSCFP